MLCWLACFLLKINWAWNLKNKLVMIDMDLIREKNLILKFSMAITDHKEILPMFHIIIKSFLFFFLYQISCGLIKFIEKPSNTYNIKLIS